MKTGASYLRYAAAAVFLAAAAWTLAFFIGREQSPETVRAERAEAGISIVAEGTVWRRKPSSSAMMPARTLHTSLVTECPAEAS